MTGHELTWGEVGKQFKEYAPFPLVKETHGVGGAGVVVLSSFFFFGEDFFTLGGAAASVAS